MIGRPKGSTKVRLNIGASEFSIIMDYIDNSTKKELTKKNAKKAFFLLYYFGFRNAELTFLTVKDIKSMIKEKKISLKNNTKTKTAREAYISDLHVGILEEVFQNELLEDSRFSLIRPWGSPMEQFRPSSLTVFLNSILCEALGNQYSTHSFRAGFITQLDEAGCSLVVIQEIMKHKNLSTTARYITVSEKRKREAVKELATVAYG